MDYSDILSRTWNTIWNHKYLVILGMLAALGTGGGGGGGGGGNGGRTGPNVNGGQPGGSMAQFCDNLPQQFKGASTEAAAIAGVVLAVVAVVVVAYLVLWVISRLGEGSLIKGVTEIQDGQASTFSSAFSGGWSKLGQLLGIGLISGIPGILLFIVAVIMGIQFVTGINWQALCAASGDRSVFEALTGGLTTAPMILLLVCCPLAIVSVTLTAIRTFADRACVTENLGVLASYERGWEVLRSNLGSAIIVLLLQIIVSIILAILLFQPRGIMAACLCIFWPVLWAISGSIRAFFSTLWTLAWRDWTGTKPGEPASLPAAPAV